jgi:folate-dependent phosphoribosylglycinamide formyltransferase PurN
VIGPLRIAWLTTGRGPGSYGALEYTFDAIDRRLPVEIAVVFVNRERGEFEASDRLITLAEDRGAPVEALSSIRFRKARGGELSKPGEPLQPWRREYDGEVAARLGRFEFGLGVMFGYMLIASEALYGRFRFINDHPALPDGPVGTYEEVIRELIRTDARESGCLMHVVTGDLDRGPVISYCRYSIRDEENETLWAAHEAGPGNGADEALYADIRRRGVVRERPFLVETLREMAEGRLDAPSKQPIELTAAVEGALDGQPGRATS